MPRTLKACGPILTALTALTALAVSGGLVLATSGTARASFQCSKRPTKTVYALGSSTMGMSLGKILKAELKSRGARVRVWGKASSGLARPDFHDWLAKAPMLMKRHRPDAVIVSLGTNDGQNIRAGKRWFSFGSKQWKRLYAGRVDTMLSRLAGPNKARPIIWLGPTALPNRRGVRRMRAITAMIRERIVRFNKAGGHASFIDGVYQTTNKDGSLVQLVRVPGRKKRHRARAKDNVHLTRSGVRWLLAEPILRRIRPCVAKRTAAR